MQKKRRTKIKLLPKFIVSLTILGLVLTVTISLFSYANTRSYLEDLYSHNATFGAKSIATMLPLEDVKTILAEGGDQTEIYTKTVQMFEKLKKEGGITFLSLVVPDEDSVTFYIDTCVPEMGDDPAAQIPYGSDILYTDAASNPDDLQVYEEGWELYAANTGSEMPLITDNSYGYNYTAVWPILDENGQAIAEIQYIIDMREVRSYLNSFLYTMLGISVGIIGVAIVCYIVFVRYTVTKPVGTLAGMMEKITRTSDFKNQHIEMHTGDEIEELGNSFNSMREELDNYIDNLAKVTAEKERIGAELSVATQIQASMLPCIFPAFPEREEFDIYANMHPAKEVGGDFYDFFLVDNDHLALVIADVSGKGVPAALFMVIAKTLIKNEALTGKAPQEVLAAVNNQLCENNDAEMFVTAWLGIYEISTGHMVASNAGHEFPAIKRRDGSFELYHDRHGFVLAGMEGSRYRPYELDLAPGDILFVYTDGVAEATNGENVLYGTDRMLSALNASGACKPKKLLDAVKTDIDRFVGDAPQFDDITMLCLEVKTTDNAVQMDSLTVPAELEQLQAVQDFIEQHLRTANCSTKAEIAIQVAVEELYVNIAHYAYAPGHGEATIRCGVGSSPKKITIQFEDAGVPFDPLAKKDADISLSADEREIGGLGILMVKKSMDHMEYERRDGKNILTIEKILE